MNEKPLPKETEEIFMDICQNVIENGMSFNSAIEASPITRTTFYKLILRHVTLKEAYNYAREVRCDTLFEQIVDISDNMHEGIETITSSTDVTIKKSDAFRHRQLQIDARKWVVSKMLPKKYGDKIDVTSNGEKIDVPVIKFD